MNSHQTGHARGPAERGLIVGFHTTDPVYSREARRLKASAERFGLAIELTPVDSAGSWVENCARKPAFLLERRRTLRGPLLYLDVDAVVHADPWPYLADYGGDAAVYYSSGGKLISSTIFLADTPGCVGLLERWRSRCEADPTIWDQVVLQGIVDVDAAAFRVERLSPAFCYVYTGDQVPLDGSAIIEQLQASREWRVERRSLWRLWRRSKRNDTLFRRRRERILAVEKELGL